METNQIGAAIDKVRELALQGTVVNGNNKQFVIVPAGYELHEIQPLEPLPRSYIDQVVTLETRESFINYVNGYKTEFTRLFRDASGFAAIFDYHIPPSAIVVPPPPEGQPPAKPLGSPLRKAHRAIYACPYSEQWLAWTGLDGRLVAQRDFAEFLEEHAIDVIEPASADLLEVATLLEVHRKINFLSGIRLGDGTNQLTYTEEDNTKAAGKKAMTVPSEVALGIPVFKGEEPYRVRALLRYRLDDGKLHFVIKVANKASVLDDAMTQLSKAIESGTDLQIFAGKAA